MEIRPVVFASESEIGRNRLLFLDRHAADSGTVSKNEAYRSTCRLFHCGLIDRTATLNLGFHVDIVDPLENVLRHAPVSGDFAQICGARAESIVDEAIARDRQIQLLWSGGIDSTVAFIAMHKAATTRNCQSRIQVLCSSDSVAEYRSFFFEHIWNKYEVQAVGFPVSSYLNADSLIVTGEHGDQLFGSDFLKPYVTNGLAFEAWQKVLPFVFAAHEVRDAEAKMVVDYLSPLMAACPVDIVTLFDFFWWLNFATKWQAVTLRIPANSDNPAAVFKATRHFFRDRDFERWSLFSHHRKRLEAWSEYKLPAKQFIFDFTGDNEYFNSKEKEQSLRLVFAGEPEWRKEEKRKREANDPKKTDRSQPEFPTGVGRVLTSDFTTAFVQPVLS